MRPYLTPQKINSYPLLFSFFVIAMLLFIFIPSAHAYDVVLGWDPNSETDLAGYRLYVSNSGSNSLDAYYEFVDEYPLSVIDENNPACQVTGLENDQPYYFVVTAYNSGDIESDFSEEICVINGQACEPRSLSAGGSGGGGSGGGNGCFISSLEIGKISSKIPNAGSLFCTLFCIMMLVICGIKNQRPHKF